MLIITGCQRSGTKTLAYILGIKHEIQFTPNITFENITKLEFVYPESSWLAQPFHSILVEKGCKIIHLVRHPMDVINSLMGIGFWDTDGETIPGYSTFYHKPYRDFIWKHLNTLSHSDPLIASMYYWICWNKPLLIYPRIRIEDIQNAPQLNHRSRASLTWDDLPEGLLKSEVKEMAEKFGYET